MKQRGMLLAIVAALAAGPADAQSTIVVSGGGSALGDAIQRAQPGDTLVVRAGYYDPIVVSIGIRILCDPGVEVGSTVPSPVPSVEIQFVPAGQELIVSGMRLPSLPRTPWVQNDVVLSVHNCLGRVVLHRLACIEPSWSDKARTEISGCPDLSLSYCQLAHTRIGASTVALSSCRTNRPTNPPLPRCTVDVFAATLFVDGGALLGGTSSISFMEAYPAIDVRFSTVTLAGDAWVDGSSFGGVYAPAIVADANTTIRIGPHARVTARVPPIQGGIVSREPVPGVGVTAAPGSTAWFDIAAEAGTWTATFVSWNVAPATTPFGTLWVDAESPVLDFGVVPAGGRRQASAPVPSSLTGVSLTAQPISFHPPSGGLHVGTAARFVLH